MIRAIGIGDNVCDKYRHLGLMFPGGQALNFSVYCRNMGYNAAYLGVFGDDQVAGHVMRTLKVLGVDFSRSRYERGENGYAEVDLKDGDRVFLRSNRGGVLRLHPIVLAQEDLEYIAQFDLVHTSNNSYIDNELPKLASLPVLLSYDFSGTWKDDARVRQVCQWLDFGFLSCSELSEREVKNQIRRLHDWGCKVVVATRGSKGGIVWDGDCFYPFMPKLVQAVDTLGAGDSFAAAFLTGYVENVAFRQLEKGSLEYRKQMDLSLSAAAEFSAKTCMQQGAFGHGTQLV